MAEESDMTDPELIDDDNAPDPARMLALAEDQQRAVAGQLGRFVPLILLSWGVAWLGGFGALWLVDGLGDAFSLPLVVAAPIFVVLLIAAGIVSTLLGIRSGRGLRGSKEATFVGMVYGQSWWVGCVAIWLLGQALVVNGMSVDLLSILYPSAYVFFVGIMYVMGGVIWKAPPMLVLGAWSIVVSVVAPFLGHPTNYLVFAVAGGGGLLLASAVSVIWTRRARRRIGGIGHD